MASTLDRPTTITVTERTRRLLESVKGVGESFDDLLQELVEEAGYDEQFYAEIARRWATEKRIRGSEVLRRAGHS